MKNNKQNWNEIKLNIINNFSRERVMAPLEANEQTQQAFKNSDIGQEGFCHLFEKNPKDYSCSCSSDCLKRFILWNKFREREKFVRGHFNRWIDNHRVDYYCYRKTTINEWGNDIKKGYYCYDCKNELFFSCYGNAPFQFHYFLVSSLNHKNSYYKAVCCKCEQKELKKRGIDTKETGTCKECQEVIDEQRPEYQKALSKYSQGLKNSQKLLKFLNLAKERDEFQDNYSSQQIKKFIEQLREDKEYFARGKLCNIERLAELDTWEKKLQACVSNYENK